MAEPREPEGGVDWQGLEAAAAAEDRPEVVDSLRQLRRISRFNSVVIEGGDPLAALLEGGAAASPRPRRGRRWTALLIGLGVVLAVVVLYLMVGRPD